ncbi:hypothetical protein IVB27_07135 [Bradyrhizobium sp. 197]|uniref:hypothetical protein n=1 Tax=Bradyrhizobium sp. 197 TaxID=2782663 RepID=UPI001FFAD819|nr:hypothetical protein [Bradyrhizobium sp. 197]MCK1474594.1 hypothetical protein [Bradyrhizobium sp. 197]
MRDDANFVEVSCRFPGVVRSRRYIADSSCGDSFPEALPRTRQDFSRCIARASLLRAINDIGRFDVSGSTVTVTVTVTVGMRMIEPKVFLTVTQKDGTFRAVDRL